MLTVAWRSAFPILVAVLARRSFRYASSGLCLTLTTPPNKRGYELYIDQLQWRYPGTIPTRKKP
mgnify:CR=1 FL=1